MIVESFRQQFGALTDKFESIPPRTTKLETQLSDHIVPRVETVERKVFADLNPRVANLEAKAVPRKRRRARKPKRRATKRTG